MNKVEKNLLRLLSDLEDLSYLKMTLESDYSDVSIKVSRSSNDIVDFNLDTDMIKILLDVVYKKINNLRDSIEKEKKKDYLSPIY